MATTGTLSKLPSLTAWLLVAATLAGSLTFVTEIENERSQEIPPAVLVRMTTVRVAAASKSRPVGLTRSSLPAMTKSAPSASGRSA